MKYMKMLGLAAIAAMALTAFVLAGPASATVLCKNNTVPCTNIYPAGTAITATQEGSSVIETTAGETLVTCTENELKGKTENKGGEMETVRIPISAFLWVGCTAITVSYENENGTFGSLEVHHIVGSKTNGTLTGKETRFTTTIFGVSCVYSNGAGADVGTLTASAEIEPEKFAQATIDINAIFSKIEGGFLCPSTVRYTASYKMTQPAQMLVKDS